MIDGKYKNIDRSKANLLLNRIIDLEKDNMKTKKLNKELMSEKIKKMIEEEVKKCF
jgi:hypothetical protein